MLIEQVAQKLQTKPEVLEREGLKLYLEKKLRVIESELFLLAHRYGVRDVTELDEMIKQGDFTRARLLRTISILITSNTSRRNSCKCWKNFDNWRWRYGEKIASRQEKCEEEKWACSQAKAASIRARSNCGEGNPSTGRREDGTARRRISLRVLRSEADRYPGRDNVGCADHSVFCDQVKEYEALRRFAATPERHFVAAMTAVLLR